ncbi:serine/threonine protein kinase [Desertihabitans brevis]|uniref:non-specific serine/threonine protein kinase n=1 Tax=Desertihabitans brevis TaxID=2268447 RepID=A0A367Z0C3_9ACTN|nr:serine/threonine-protein kinase [Desertihabitans brevis]RCK70712.1 serine/threonine protein kinase [Desertihabitans brevis]
MTQVGRYRLVRRLGVGSFATVWLAAGPGGEVAVKVLAENWAVDADVRARFLAEARLLQRIADPRLVAVHEIGTLPDGRPWFAMDHCPGGSLDDLRRQRLPADRALRLTAEAARCLHVLHEHGVVHRDVTPGNLLLDADGRVRLADLGVAKDLSVGTGSTMTAGTPAYMAWEQATGGALDRRCDVYSLACVGYALLTGRPPFPVRTLADLVARGPDARPPAVAEAVACRPGWTTCWEPR